MKASHRLSVKDSPAPGRAFEFAQKAADAGLYALLGAEFSCVPHEMYPPDWTAVQACRGFDSAFTPVGVREAWLSPTGGVSITFRYLIARRVLLPREEYAPLNCVYPSFPIHGMRFSGPLIEAGMLDDTTDLKEEQTMGAARSELPRYVPFDMRAAHTMAAIWHQNQHKRTKDLKAEIVDAQVDAPKRVVAKQMDELRYRQRHDWGRLERIRQAETHSDRMKAAAPREAQPYVFIDRRGVA